MERWYKHNKNFNPSYSGAQNLLYSRFKQVFDNIFEPNGYVNQENNADIPYVKNEQIESELQSIIDHPAHYFSVMTGGVGIGKSTYIRNNLARKNTPQIVGSTIYLPFYGNAQSVLPNEVRSLILDRSRSAFDLITEQFSIKYSKKSIYKYIADHNRPLLFKSNESTYATKEERIDILAELDPYSYQAELLKYACENSEIDTIFIVVDDFEGLPITEQQPLIEQIHTFFQCMFNNYENKYSVKLLISLRPETYDTLVKTNIFSTYPANKIFGVETPVSLKLMLEKRFEVLKNRPELYGKIINKEEYDDASDVFQEILGKFNNTIMQLILGLCNHNLRDAIIVLARVICNKQWLQYVRPPVGGAFKLNVSQFSISTINICKALIFLESTIYSDHIRYSKTNNVHPLGNIFKNREGENPIRSYYFAILLFRLGRENGHGTFVPKRELQDSMRKIGVRGKDFKTLYDYVIKYNFVAEDSEFRNERAVPGLILRPKITALADLINLSGIYYFSMRDDIWINIDSTYSRTFRKDTAKLSGLDVAHSKLEFLSYLLECEERIIDSIPMGKKRQSFVKSFGNESIVGLLCTGLKEDLHKTNAFHNTSIQESMNESDKKIKALNQKIIH